MCLGIPGKVLKIDGRKSEVEIMGVTREVSLELLKQVKIGDYVLIHAGCAIQVIDEDEAQKTLELFNELRELVNE
ncbi:MAG TPA: HypC/HybG/HupF family hydrogenase formation chaperone [Clostridia bacterium]|nr:HypC/HybG/HupF family hydrogenase formation chaperone [Clostridia bacterium]